jgi:hypothetical protein
MSAPTVFLLWHSRDVREGETNDTLVGVYSTRAEAEAAIARKLAFEGFRDFPHGFLIDSYELDQDAWPEGFVVEE